MVDRDQPLINFGFELLGDGGDGRVGLARANRDRDRLVRRRLGGEHHVDPARAERAEQAFGGSESAVPPEPRTVSNVRFPIDATPVAIRWPLETFALITVPDAAGCSVFLIRSVPEAATAGAMADG